MARLVRHEATGPRKLDASDVDAEKGDIAVCQCGLSEEYPFCDGTHRATRDEASDVLYCYEGDDENHRRVVVDIDYDD
ncbi:CDGSH iron-sulfur domain-containing protein [Halomarina litorea]|uniref:CDGSH iron-sulfur domain-containing protein n=1 Tax=Halomarina litorea TaxID=2961595 RepID=UPI0020C557EC|nr:CDGSH iron-sulfur domain-containing protein [Halomarina sp. BCD28]